MYPQIIFANRSDCCGHSNGEGYNEDMDNGTSQQIIDTANGAEASGITGKELGVELGITTRAANKVAAALAAEGKLINTGWCRTSGRRRQHMRGMYRPARAP